MDTNLAAINNALFASVVPEEQESQEDTGIVNVDPDDYDTLGREQEQEYDDDDDYTSDYDEWIDNTYWLGDDEASLLEELRDKISNTIEDLTDDDKRFYYDDYRRITDMINHLNDKITELNNFVSNNYSTFD